MLRFGMDLNLAEIARGNLSDQVFQVIKVAEARGLVGQLLQSALTANPTNPDLRELALVFPAVGDVTDTSEDARRGRKTLLEDVISEARDRLRSIGIETPIPILLEQQPYQLARPWDSEADVRVRPRPAAPVNDILRVFDDAEVGGRLLILGAPGSGKTTVVLQLMQELAARVNRDPSRPIPVLVSLASWTTDKNLATWFVDQLKLKYGVRIDLGSRWRDNRAIAPLFDGLDEVLPEHQPACVEAINEFQQAYGPPSLVVCSRRAEYENLTVKIRLRGAVCLLPFDSDQIRAYLERSGHLDRWTAIAGDPALMEMAQSPLLLSLITALPDAENVQDWQDAPSAAERRQRLLDTYLSSRASPEARSRAYSPEQTLAWLRRLATMMKEHGQAEFLTERMQPEWLNSSFQRWSYRSGVLIATVAAVRLVMQSLLSIFESFPRGRVGLALQSVFRAIHAETAAFNELLLLLIAVAVGAVVASRTSILPIETLTWSWSEAWTNMRRWGRRAFMAGLDYGTAFGVAVMLVTHFALFDMSETTSGWQRAGIIAGDVGGVGATLLLALIKPSRWLRYVRYPSVSRRLIDSLTVGAVYAFVIGPTLTVGAGLLAALGVSAMVGCSRASNDRSRDLVVKVSFIGLISGAAIGALSSATISSVVPFVQWLGIWAAGGLVVGTIAGVAITLALQSARWLQPRGSGLALDRWWTWTRTAFTGLAIGSSLGLAAIVSASAGHQGYVRNLTLLVLGIQQAFVSIVGLTVFGAIVIAAASAATAGTLGALSGVLGGATGAPVERRLVPNQGIHQSAANVAIFAALGILVIGLPYGLLNASVSAATMRLLPTWGDWLRLAIAPGVAFGVLAGLLPGAACIQHFVLRFVLWTSGALPLRLVRFLNYATRRRLLQRVGGRYRFIHVLLRDHLSDASVGMSA